MPALSAPSAKIFTRRSCSEVIRPAKACLMPVTADRGEEKFSLFQDPLRRFKEIPGTIVRSCAKRFIVSVIDENRCAPRRRPAIDVAPAVTDHKAGGQMHAEFG